MQYTSEGLIAACDKLSAALARVQEGSGIMDRVGEIKGTCSEFLKTMRRIKNFVPAQGGLEMGYCFTVVLGLKWFIYHLISSVVIDDALN